MHILKALFLLSLSFCANIFAAHTNQDNADFSTDINVIITDEAWQHITVGKLDGTNYSGGHDWPAYESAAKPKNVFFDTFLNVYVVDSPKGDGLVRIMKNLRNNKSARYHTCFPAGILTREFVTAAFKKAWSLNSQNFSIHGKDSNIDFSSNLFYVEHEQFKVAGHFEALDSNTFVITTCFPDLSWYYRISFKHKKEIPFFLERFLAFDAKEDIWVRHGSPEKMPKGIDRRLWPQPTAHISVQLAENGEGQQVTSEIFTAFIEIYEAIYANYLKGDARTEDVLSLFFANPQAPLAKEIQALGDAMGKFIRLFKKQKYKTVAAIADEINRKSTMNTIKNRPHVAFKFLVHNREGRFVSNQDWYNLPAHEFSEAIAYQMLALHTGSFFKPDNHHSDDNLYKLAKNFHDNLQNHLLNHDATLIKMMQDNQLVFSLTQNVHTAAEHYSLSVINVKDITPLSWIAQQHPYVMAATWKATSNSPYKFQLSSIIKLYKVSHAAHLKTERERRALEQFEKALTDILTP